MTYETWVRERGTEPAIHCPIIVEGDEAEVILGLTLLGTPPAPARVIGEFWYDDAGELHAEPYPGGTMTDPLHIPVSDLLDRARHARSIATLAARRTALEYLIDDIVRDVLEPLDALRREAEAAEPADVDKVQFAALGRRA